MNNLLYIGHAPDIIQSGADLVNTNNLSVLQKIYGKDNICQVDLGEPSIIEKLCLYCGGATKLVEKRVLKELNNGGCSTVFVTSSLLGRIVRKIHKHFPNVKTIVFFHNVERFYAVQQLRVVGIRKLITTINILINELLAVRNSSIRIALNKRDDGLLYKYYGLRADYLLPVICADHFVYKAAEGAKKEDKSLLFVGSAFFANIEGLRWYLKNVHPYVNAHLTIVGKGMDKYQHEFSSDTVTVKGFVDDISEYYYKSSAVIAPILSGGGMKTKTAEAFMFGKTVIGTREAFEGYVIDPTYSLICNDRESFINNISSFLDLEKPHFNAAARQCYERYYSPDAVENSLMFFLRDNNLI